MQYRKDKQVSGCLGCFLIEIRLLLYIHKPSVCSVCSVYETNPDFICLSSLLDPSYDQSKYHNS